MLKRPLRLTMMKQRLSGKPLSGRETEVARLLGEGLSNKLIAGVLGIADSTAKFHVENVMRKLDAENRTQAAVKFVLRGRVDSGSHNNETA